MFLVEPKKLCTKINCLRVHVYMQGYPKASSVLGPLLLLININDVAENIMSFCRLFADDNLIQHMHKKSERYQINSDP